MDMVSILSRVVSGLAVRAIVGGLAIWAAIEVYSYVRHVFAATSAAMGVR